MTNKNTQLIHFHFCYSSLNYLVSNFRKKKIEQLTCVGNFRHLRVMRAPYFIYIIRNIIRILLNLYTQHPLISATISFIHVHCENTTSCDMWNPKSARQEQSQKAWYYTELKKILSLTVLKPPPSWIRIQELSFL